MLDNNTILLFQTFKLVFSPEKDWGPAVEKNRTGRYAEPGSELPPSYNSNHYGNGVTDQGFPHDKPVYNGYDGGTDNPGYKDMSTGEQKF